LAPNYEAGCFQQPKQRTTNQPVGWTKEIHQQSGNLLLDDGSVQPVDSAGLQKALRDSGVATNRLAIP